MSWPLAMSQASNPAVSVFFAPCSLAEAALTGQSSQQAGSQHVVPCSHMGERTPLTQGKAPLVDSVWPATASQAVDFAWPAHVSQNNHPARSSFAPCDSLAEALAAESMPLTGASQHSPCGQMGEQALVVQASQSPMAGCSQRQPAWPAQVAQNDNMTEPGNQCQNSLAACNNEGKSLTQVDESQKGESCSAMHMQMMWPPRCTNGMGLHVVAPPSQNPPQTWPTAPPSSQSTGVESAGECALPIGQALVATNGRPAAAGQQAVQSQSSLEALVPTAKGPAGGRVLPGGDVQEDLLRFFCAGDYGRRLVEQASGGGSSSSTVPMTRARVVTLDLEAMDLFEAVPSAYQLLEKWKALQEILNSAAQQALTELCPLPVEGHGAGRRRVVIRLLRVPGMEFARQSVSQLRVMDEGRFVRVVGTVTRAGSVKVVQEWREFKCEQCGHTFGRRASPASGYEFEVPSECPGGQKKSTWDSKAKRPKTMRCHSKSFLPQPAAEDGLSDFQELRVQDELHALDAGAVPQSVAVTLFGDLVGSVQPGDSVVVEGVVYQRWRTPWQGKRVEVELFVEATHVERLARDAGAEACGHAPHEKLLPEMRDAFQGYWIEHKEDEWKGRAAIIAATAPWLSGLPVPKLALLLTLIGGAAPATSGLAAQDGSLSGERESRWNRFLSGTHGQQDQQASAQAANSGEAVAASSRQGTMHARMTPHLLLLGDPGTGKSQLLQAAQELAGRSVRTSGLGCTSAGLTCAAVREGPDWVLEAGALVLADGGVCCIDEFSTIRSHDKAAVHEAMEQQTVSVAKAGLVCRLRSRCSVVAAQNCRNSTSTGKARGHGVSYDSQASLAVNSGLPPPLLSRFDLVVVFADGSKGGASEQDKADFILGSSSAAPKDAATGDASSSGEGSVDKISQWSHDKLRDYVTWARGNPLTGADEPAAAELLQGYFHRLRSQDSGVTVRTLESLVRLTQAHAKLMGHKAILIRDAVAVIILHKASLQGHVVGCEDGLGDRGEDFPISMRDLQDETPSCNVNVKMEGVDLHHGVDIANEGVYRLLEQHVLRNLRMHFRPGTRILEDAPKPIQDRVVPRQVEQAAASQVGAEVQAGALQAAPQQKGWAAAALPAAAAARAMNSQRQPPSQGVATTAVKPRGARLGFRLR
eukprot:TRINITY_DN27757_c0_g1_i1.p1 TRINITY_DN27757_c0_g1~~TRINITY_DN27757_c0_g1_i1.p1  ORF type:complete len:1152 (+),score=227.96 TRINITY_DN27757_c0_g1_i1:25-3480(+)